RHPRRRRRGRLSQHGHPRQGDPRDQARPHRSLRPPVGQPRCNTEVVPPPRGGRLGRGAGTREYRWTMPRGWWTRRSNYFWYIVREFTSLPLALWLLWFLVEIRRAQDGPGGYQPHSSIGFVIFSVIVLLFALYHTVTFISLAAAILLPVHILVQGILGPLGIVPVADRHYDTWANLLGNPLVKLYLLVLIAFPFFHFAHRLRYLLVDLGVPAARGVPAQIVFYGGAVAVTLVTIYILLTTGPLSL